MRSIPFLLAIAVGCAETTVLDSDLDESTAAARIYRAPLTHHSGGATFELAPAAYPPQQKNRTENQDPQKASTCA